MKPLTVRVVNLASRVDRREQVAAQFARVGVASYSFFEAVNGTANPHHPLFRLYDPPARRRIKGRGRDLKPSQLGLLCEPLPAVAGVRGLGRTAHRGGG
ncbi:hypothetical protein CDEF62S_04781 [Castellaniella defragrans]